MIARDHLLRVLAAKMELDMPGKMEKVRQNCPT